MIRLLFLGDKDNGRPANSEILQAMQGEGSGDKARNESRTSLAPVTRNVPDLGADLDTVRDQNRWLEVPDVWV